jgi:hypothetical protein
MLHDDISLLRSFGEGQHYILGPFGEDSDLRRWGLKIAEGGGKMPRNERWLPWLESWRYCYIGCG